MKELILNSEYINKIFPKRLKISNKSTYGKVINIVGSKNFVGAGYLSSVSSISVGAGYSAIVCPKSLLSAYASKTSDIIFYPYEDNEKGYLSEENIKSFAENLSSYDVVLMGCGLGLNEATFKAVKQLLELFSVTDKIVVLDADALNAISALGIKNLPKNSVITPHPMEAQRLLNIDKEVILSDVRKYAKMLAEKYNTNCVLKTYQTVICSKKGELFINNTGNSALAKAGTGDVLAGMIAGFSAQTKNILNGSLLGVYLHGKIAEIYAKQNSEYTLLPSKMFDYIDLAIKNI